MKKSRISINFIYQTAYQMLTVITPLITAPYIARILGSENNGIYTYTFTIANYFVVFAALGIEAYGNRLIAQAKAGGKDALNRAFSGVFWMHFLVAAVVTAAYFVYACFFAEPYRMAALLQSAWVVAALIDINWLFCGLEEFRLTATRNFVMKLLTVSCVFLFVRSEADLWKYTLVMGLGTLVGNAVLWGKLGRYVRFIRVDRREIQKHFSPLLRLFLAVVATSIYRMIDKVMLGRFDTMTSLAAYEYADKVIKMSVTLITALGTVMLPRMSALYAEGKNDIAVKYVDATSRFMFTAAFALAFGLAGIADEFMPVLLGAGYEESALLVKILAISLPMMGWNNLIRTQILIPKGNDRIYTGAVWAGALVNIVLNYGLIRRWGAIGAAIATVIAYGIVGLFQTCPLAKAFDMAKYLAYAKIPFASGMIMFAGIRLVSTCFQPGVLCIVVEIIVGGVLYLLINLIYLIKTKDEIRKQAERMLKCRLNGMKRK